MLVVEVDWVPVSDAPLEVEPCVLAFPLLLPAELGEPVLLGCPALELLL